MPGEVSCLHAVVDGHVQGVGFRYFVKENAEYLHITGWVRNLINGEVELLAEGNRETLDRFLEMVRRGPSRSMVTEINCDWSNGTQKHTLFSILPTE